FALVIGLSAASNKELNLGDPLLEIDRQRNQRQTLLPRLGVQLGNLPAVQQELATPLGNEIHAVGLEVFGNVTPEQPDLAVIDLGVRVFQVGLTVAQALDLGAGQNQPCFDLLEQLVLVPGLVIPGNGLDTRIVGLCFAFGGRF